MKKRFIFARHFWSRGFAVARDELCASPREQNKRAIPITELCEFFKRAASEYRQRERSAGKIFSTGMKRIRSQKIPIFRVFDASSDGITVTMANVREVPLYLRRIHSVSTNLEAINIRREIRRHVCVLREGPPATGSELDGRFLVSFRGTVNHLMILVVRSMDTRTSERTLVVHAVQRGPGAKLEDEERLRRQTRDAMNPVRR